MCVWRTMLAVHTPWPVISNPTRCVWRVTMIALARCKWPHWCKQMFRINASILFPTQGCYLGMLSSLISRVKTTELFPQVLRSCSVAEVPFSGSAASEASDYVEPHQMCQSRINLFLSIIQGCFGDILPAFPLWNQIFSIYILNQEWIWVLIGPEYPASPRGISPMIDWASIKLIILCKGWCFFAVKK